MPLFSWLPKAHGTPGAPSVVSAILSGLHIKCGVYLFIRFQSVFAEVMIPEFFMIIGIITGIAGVLLALSQTDVKLILAYSTISQIGLIMIGLNASDVYSHTGSIYHIINHAIFKSALFMCAGIVTHAYGTRDISKIRGVLKRYPIVGAATAMAVLGIIGTPAFNGSISKYFITAGLNWAVEGSVILINLGTIIVFTKYSAMLFSTERVNGSFEPQSGAEELLTRSEVLCPFKQAAVLVLGALCLAGGIFGERLIGVLFNVSVNVDTGGYIKKTAIFAISVIAGYLIFRFVIGKTSLFKRIRNIDLSFRWICASIGGFFAVTMVVMRLFG